MRAEITSLRGEKYVGEEHEETESKSLHIALGKFECEESRAIVWCQIGKGSRERCMCFLILFYLFILMSFNE